MSRTSSNPSESKTALASVVLIAASGLAGCASIPASVSDFGSDEPVSEIESAPFFPQKRYQCGPAALTTVLSHSGVEATLGSVTELTYIPDRQGSLQTELISTARHYDRIPYEIDGTMSALAAELAAGRPVLVLQNLGISWFPRWHYAVVVGVDAASGRVVLRSGTERRRASKIDTFLRTWQRSDYWAVVTLRPGELPANPDRDRYFRAIAGMEAAGHYGSAMSAWNSALDRWPGDAVALFGKANSAYQLGELEVSERTYRSLLHGSPDMHAARNNLAYVLAEQGKLAEALEEMQWLLDHTDDSDPLRDEFESSFSELHARASRPPEAE